MTIKISTIYDTASDVQRRISGLVDTQIAAEDLGMLEEVFHEHLLSLRYATFRAAGEALGLEAAEVEEFYLEALDRVPIDGEDNGDLEVEALVEILIEVCDVDFEEPPPMTAEVPASATFN